MEEGASFLWCSLLMVTPLPAQPVTLVVTIRFVCGMPTRGNRNKPLRNRGAYVAFSPDGKTLVTASGNEVHFWDAHTGEYKQALRSQPDLVRSIAFSPDGEMLATGSGAKIRLWNARSRKYLRTLQGHTASVFSIAFSPDGRTLATVSRSEIRMWDARTGELLRTLGGAFVRCVLAGWENACYWWFKDSFVGCPHRGTSADP